jgi:hypothetical protein
VIPMTTGRGERTDFMSQARMLASGTREPHIAWSYLKRWATGKGPLAMKAAMIGFLEQHGSRPESAAIIPEMMAFTSQISPPERKDIIEFANRSYSSISGFAVQSVGKSAGPTGLPAVGDAHALSSAFRPKSAPSAPLAGAGQRFLASRDMERMVAMRDEVFRVSDAMKASSRIQPPSIQSNHPNPSVPSKPPVSMQRLPPPISRESFEPVFKAHKGHAIMRSLIERVRSHGRSEFITEVGKSKARGESAAPVKRKRRVVSKRIAVASKKARRRSVAVGRGKARKSAKRSRASRRSSVSRRSAGKRMMKRRR